MVAYTIDILSDFPERVARVPVSLGGLGVRLCSPNVLTGQLSQHMRHSWKQPSRRFFFLHIWSKTKLKRSTWWSMSISFVSAWEHIFLKQYPKPAKLANIGTFERQCKRHTTRTSASVIFNVQYMHYMVRACVKARQRQPGPLRARAPDVQKRTIVSRKRGCAL